MLCEPRDIHARTAKKKEATVSTLYYQYHSTNNTKYFEVHNATVKDTTRADLQQRKTTTYRSSKYGTGLQHSSALLCTALHYAALHHTKLYNTLSIQYNTGTIYCTNITPRCTLTQHCTNLPYNTSHDTVILLHFIAPGIKYTTLLYTLDYNTLYCTTTHCTALPRTLHCTAQHSTTLHHTTFHDMLDSVSFHWTLPPGTLHPTTIHYTSAQSIK